MTVGARPAGAARPSGPVRDNGPPRPAQISRPNWLLAASRNRELPPGIHAADPFPDGMCVLTFDDGPSARSTPRVMEILRRHGQRGAFFVVGRQIGLDTYRLVQRAVRDGHVVGNHGYRHDVGMSRPERGRGADYVRQELLLTQALLDLALLARSDGDFLDLQERVLGSIPDEDGLPWQVVASRWPDIRIEWRAVLGERLAGLSPYPMLFARPPGGQPYTRTGTPERRLAFSRHLRELELLNILWHASAGDSDPRLPEDERWRPERLAHNVMQGVRRGGVILMHDRMPGRALDHVLRAIEHEPGCLPMSLDDAIRFKYGRSPDAVLARLPSSL